MYTRSGIPEWSCIFRVTMLSALHRGMSVNWCIYLVMIYSVTMIMFEWSFCAYESRCTQVGLYLQCVTMFFSRYRDGSLCVNWFMYLVMYWQCHYVFSTWTSWGHKRGHWSRLQGWFRTECQETPMLALYRWRSSWTDPLCSDGYVLWKNKLCTGTLEEIRSKRLNN